MEINVTQGKAEATEDLSQEIRQTIAREPGELVRCARVGENAYRCNWWTSAAGAAAATTHGGDTVARFLLVTTSRVGRSRFLTATRVGGKLVIEDATADPG
jgi:hypothetical protein